VPDTLTLKTPVTGGLVHDICSEVGLNVINDVLCPMFDVIVAV